MFSERNEMDVLQDIKRHRPEGRYDKDSEEWAQFAFYLADRYFMSMSDACETMGVNYNTAMQHPIIRQAVQAGHAAFKARQIQGLEEFANADPMQAFPEDRPQVRALKLDARKTLQKAGENREKLRQQMLQGQAQNALLKELTDEQLRAKAAELLRSPNTVGRSKDA